MGVSPGNEVCQNFICLERVADGRAPEALCALEGAAEKGHGWVKTRGVAVEKTPF